MPDQTGPQHVPLDELLAHSPDAEHADRTVAGHFAAVELIDALARNDAAAAESVLESCDPAPTLVGLATAFIALCHHTGAEVADMLDSMRSALAVPNGGRRG